MTDSSKDSPINVPHCSIICALWHFAIIIVLKCFKCEQKLDNADNCLQRWLQQFHHLFMSTFVNVSLPLLLLRRGVSFSTLKFGLGHVDGFGQQNMSKCDKSRGLKSAYASELTLFCLCWNPETTLCKSSSLPARDIPVKSLPTASPE